MRCKALLQSWRLRWNELSGPNAAPLEHMAGECQNIDDIEVIGPPDTTWCYFFESTFGRLIEMPTNKKEMELTYARVENRLLFSKIYRMKALDSDGMLPYERADAWFKAVSSHVEQNNTSTGVLCAKSQTTAMDMWAVYRRYGMTDWRESISKKGVLIGYGEKRECIQEEAIALQNAYNLSELPKSEVLEYQAIMLKGSIFRRGDTMVVCNENVSDGQWYGKMRYIFTHKQGLETNVFFAANYYRYCCMAEIQVDESSGIPIIAEGMEPFDHESILPVRHILREVCMLPLREGTDKRTIAFETMTNKLPERLLQLHKVGNIPIWPLEGDVVAVQAVKHGIDPHLSSYDGCWYAIVAAVNEADRKVKLTWLKSSCKKRQECFEISYDER